MITLVVIVFWLTLSSIIYLGIVGYIEEASFGPASLHIPKYAVIENSKVFIEKDYSLTKEDKQKIQHKLDITNEEKKKEPRRRKLQTSRREPSIKKSKSKSSKTVKKSK